MEVTLLCSVAGKKRKDQHDANLAGMGLNPAYSGAYGATPTVSFFCCCRFFGGEIVNHQRSWSC